MSHGRIKQAEEKIKKNVYNLQTLRSWSKSFKRLDLINKLINKKELAY